jgi:hypothetical protein
MQAFGEASKHGLTPSATSVGGSANLSQPSAPRTSAGGEATLCSAVAFVWNRTQRGYDALPPWQENHTAGSPRSADTITRTPPGAGSTRERSRQRAGTTQPATTCSAGGSWSMLIPLRS